MEGGGCATGGSDGSPSELDLPVGTDGGLAPALCGRVSPDDCSADGGDAGLVLSDRPTSLGAAADGAGRGWALAMFGEDWFGEDVIQYAENLGQHTAACLEVKTQVGEGALRPFCPVSAVLPWPGAQPGWRLNWSRMREKTFVERKCCGAEY